MKSRPPTASPAVTAPQQGARLLLSCGTMRTSGNNPAKDPVPNLLRRLSARHTVVSLICEKDDPAIAAARALAIPVHILLPELARSRKQIALALETPAFQARFQRWLAPIRRAAPDLGLMFLGNWIPPALTAIPRLGFLNFHPAPLPDLRGIEPETFAVLQRRRTFHATIHQASENFDEGPILLRGPSRRIPADALPIWIFHKMCQDAPALYARAVDGLISGTLHFTRQKRGGFTTSMKALREAALIDWKTDSISTITRKLMATSMHPCGVRARAPMPDGTLVEIEYGEVHPGRYLGRPGDILGTLPLPRAASPVTLMRARDGCVALWPLARQENQRPWHAPRMLALPVPPARPQKKRLSAAQLNPYRSHPGS